MIRKLAVRSPDAESASVTSRLTGTLRHCLAWVAALTVLGATSAAMAGGPVVVVEEGQPEASP